MSASGSANGSVADPAAKERGSEGGTGTERESGTKRGGGTAGDLMMSHPVGPQALLFSVFLTGFLFLLKL